MKWFLPLVLVSILGCSEQHATRPSPDVTFHGDYLLYRGRRFTGILEEKFDQVETVRKTHYRGGLSEGIQEEFFKNGQIVARREYNRGQKVGIHRGWYPDGTRRFHYEFSDGQYDGESWEWYGSGNLAMYARFVKGHLLGKKLWRETGQIYMNYVFPENKAVGLPGSHLCYQVRGR